jgi:formylglycine-generating enzyme required for sulfatase activity
MRAWHGVAGTALLVLAWSATMADANRAAPGPADSWTEPRTGMVLVALPTGRFVMGSPPSEPYRQDTEGAHDVTISTPIWIGRFEVTQAQWHTVMGTSPSRFDGDARRPVENVNWVDVQDFLRRLTASSDDSRFRLPTEAEWEYACRAGSTTAYHVGPSLGPDEARIDPRRPDDPAGPPASGGPLPVGAFAANAWGLHDMHGNVWEWTDDGYCEYPSAPVTDPRPTCRAPLRVIRGGSWYFRADSARCASRYTHRPEDRGFSLGFRVVREVGPR